MSKKVKICPKCGTEYSDLQVSCLDCGTILRWGVKEETEEIEDTKLAEKSPWGWWTLLTVSFFAGFAAGGIVAGINWRRMGKQGLMWPTIIGSIVAFILFVYFLPQTVSNSTASFISVAPLTGLWLWQKGYYRTWKDSHPEAQRAGWQIPAGTALGAIVVVVAIVFTPTLMLDEATKQYNQGVDLQEEGKLSQAITAYDEAIRLDPQFAEAYCNRALCQYHLGNLSEALEDSNKAIDLNPQIAEAYCNRALCQYLLGNLSEALEDNNKAIELTPNDAMSYWLRGLICFDLGKTEQAIADLEKALDLGLEPLQQEIAEMALAELTTSE